MCPHPFSIITSSKTCHSALPYLPTTKSHRKIFPLSKGENRSTILRLLQHWKMSRLRSLSSLSQFQDLFPGQSLLSLNLSVYMKSGYFCAINSPLFLVSTWPGIYFGHTRNIVCHHLLLGCFSDFWSTQQPWDFLLLSHPSTNWV